MRGRQLRPSNRGDRVRVRFRLRRLNGTMRSVGVTLDVSLLCEPQVTTVGLALAGERLLEVFVSLGAVEAHDCLSFVCFGCCFAELLERRTLKKPVVSSRATCT